MSHFLVAAACCSRRAPPARRDNLPRRGPAVFHSEKMSTAAARPRLPAELRPDQVTAIIDNREQLPLDLSPLQTVAGTLATADYSVRGLETVVAVERKSLSDMLGCIGQHREGEQTGGTDDNGGKLVA